jgi:putative hydrolase of the HAD superfamily
MDIQAVAFDLDGTLYPNYKMYLRSVPFFVAHPRLVRHFGKIRRVIRTVRPIYNFRWLQAELLAGSLRISTAQAAELIERNIYGRWEETFRKISAYVGAREALQTLRAEGLRLAVISDFPVHRKLKYLGLDDLFDCAFSSEEIGYLKPNPEPFLSLAQRLSLPPDQIMYVGNNYKYDILGAREVGMRSAHLSRKRMIDSKADLTFTNYGELRDSILKYAHTS